MPSRGENSNERCFVLRGDEISFLRGDIRHLGRGAKMEYESSNGRNFDCLLRWVGAFAISRKPVSYLHAGPLGTESESSVRNSRKLQPITDLHMKTLMARWIAHRIEIRTRHLRRALRDYQRQESARISDLETRSRGLRLYAAWATNRKRSISDSSARSFSSKLSTEAFHGSIPATA
jgi:hypothetical protein